MSGFHIATICADCDPPVVAISTGYGSRCPRCGQVEDGSSSRREFLLAEKCALTEMLEKVTGVLERASLEARLDTVLEELAAISAAKPYLASSNQVSDVADGALARHVIASAAVRSDGDAWQLRELAQRLLARVERERSADADANADDADDDGEVVCPHCQAGEPSVWDGHFEHFAHPAGDKFKFCHRPWRARCRRCSADVEGDAHYCATHAHLEAK